MILSLPLLCTTTTKNNIVHTNIHKHILIQQKKGYSIERENSEYGNGKI